MPGRGEAFPVRVYRITWAAVTKLTKHDGLELAGHLSFTALLSLFPFMLFLAGLAGFLGDAETARHFIGFLFEFTPDDVAETLAPAIYDVLAKRQGGLLTLGAVGTLWAASGGIEALRLVLNRAYEIVDPRPIWLLRLQSIGFTIGGACAIFIASVSVVFGPIIWDLLDRVFYLPEGFWLWTVGRYVIACLLLGLFLVALHRLLPYKTQHVRTVVPGVLATLAIWILASTLFSLYLGTIGDYSATYGALGGVIISMMFFYFASVAFIFGAELNARLLGLAGAPETPGRVQN